MVENYTVVCSKKFGDTATNARCRGYRNARCAVTMKLLGNVAYGKNLTNKAKHVDVSYVRGEGTIQCVNNPRFKRMSAVAEDIFEVEELKKKVCWDLPSGSSSTSMPSCAR